LTVPQSLHFTCRWLRQTLQVVDPGLLTCSHLGQRIPFDDFLDVCVVSEAVGMLGANLFSGLILQELILDSRYEILREIIQLHG
jgi:hypothetical protein